MKREALLDLEHGATAQYVQALRAAGIPLRLAFEPGAFDVFARVLARVHGEP